MIQFIIEREFDKFNNLIFVYATLFDCRTKNANVRRAAWCYTMRTVPIVRKIYRKSKQQTIAWLHRHSSKVSIGREIFRWAEMWWKEINGCLTMENWNERTCNQIIELGDLVHDKLYVDLLLLCEILGFVDLAHCRRRRLCDFFFCVC